MIVRGLRSRALVGRRIPLSRRRAAAFSSSELSAALEQSSKAVESAEAIVVTCGAGMGLDSGLPDFRGDEGFWKASLILDIAAPLLSSLSFHASRHSLFSLLVTVRSSTACFRYSSLSVHPQLVSLPG